MEHMRTSRRALSAGCVLAIALATTLIAAPASSATDASYLNCTIRATEPWLTGKQHTYDTVNGSGKVFCGTGRSLRLTVRLQEQDRIDPNSWTTVESVTKGPRTTNSLYAELNHPCAYRTSTSYRTRVTGRVDGIEITVTSDTTDC